MNTTTAAALPDLLRLADPGVREQLEALPASMALIGHGANGQAVTVDVDADPHVLVRTGGGAGSTTLLRTLTAQLLHHGAHALVLDIQQVSHPWAHELPAVTHRADVTGIHDALVGLVPELRRRIDYIDQHGGYGGLPRLAVVFDGVDAARRQLVRHWQTVRESGDPKVSPAVDALSTVLHVGRQARIHVLLDGRPTADVLGPQAREQFSTVVLAQITADTWRHLAPTVGPAPKGRPHPGRVHVVHHGTARQAQVLHLTEGEATAWATPHPIGSTRR